MGQKGPSRFKRCLKSNNYYYQAAEYAADGQQTVPAIVTSYVFAPALCWYVLSILKEAVRTGKKRLYFLARDGYFFHRAAMQFCEKMKLDIDCRYIYCSRYSLRIPAYHIDFQSALNYICSGGIDVTFRKIMGRTGLSEEEQNVVQKEIAFGDIDAVIPYTKLFEIRKKLEDSSSFKKYLNNRSKEYFSVLKDYLEQEGLLDNCPMAIVDSGWTGSMQKVLNQVLKQCGKKDEVVGYYWGLYELQPDTNAKEYKTFYFAPYRNIHDKVNFNNNLFEIVFSAPHGSTYGYKVEGEHIEPYFMETEESQITLVKTEEKIFDRFIRYLTDNDEKKSTQLLHIPNKQMIRELLRLLMAHPDKKEANYYGNCFFSDDMLDKNRQKLAVYLDEAELKQNHFLPRLRRVMGFNRKKFKESAWYEGSAVLYGKHQCWHLYQYHLYRYFLYINKLTKMGA